MLGLSSGSTRSTGLSDARTRVDATGNIPAEHSVGVFKGLLGMCIDVTEMQLGHIVGRPGTRS